MVVIYVVLVYMGVISLGSVNCVDNGGSILLMVSNYYFGVLGKVLLVVIIGIVCVKIVIGLIILCFEMFSEMFLKLFLYKKYVIVFIVFFFVIVNFGLSNII